jgi:hypothetical protein
LNYVTIIPYLPGITKVSKFHLPKVSLSKFARLYKTNSTLFFFCRFNPRWIEALSAGIGGYFWHLVEKEAKAFPAARDIC